MDRPYSEAPAALNRAFYDVVTAGYGDADGHDPIAPRSPSPAVVDLLAHFGVGMDFYEAGTDTNVGEPYPYEF